MRSEVVLLHKDWEEGGVLRKGGEEGKEEERVEGLGRGRCGNGVSEGKRVSAST